MLLLLPFLSLSLCWQGNHTVGFGGKVAFVEGDEEYRTHSGSKGGLASNNAGPLIDIALLSEAPVRKHAVYCRRRALFFLDASKVSFGLIIPVLVQGGGQSRGQSSFSTFFARRLASNRACQGCEPKTTNGSVGFPVFRRKFGRFLSGGGLKANRT